MTELHMTVESLRYGGDDGLAEDLVILAGYPDVEIADQLEAAGRAIYDEYAAMAQRGAILQEALEAIQALTERDDADLLLARLVEYADDLPSNIGTIHPDDGELEGDYAADARYHYPRRERLIAGLCVAALAAAKRAEEGEA